MPDFYAQVPKDLQANLAYRLELRRRAASDPRFRRACTAACRHDILFWMNAFCFLYEPRPRLGPDGRPLPKVIPFITWPHQDIFITTIKDRLGFEDIGVEKSRGEGASWIGVLFALHDWLFEPLTAIGLVSKDENSVDDPEDPDSLFWKIDWELTKLPRWMAGVKDVDYKRKLSEHTLRNLRNQSTIVGYAATADVGSGGRKKWFLMDELAKFPRGPDEDAMASTQHVTDSRLVVSTPKGAEGAYYQIMHEPSNMIKVVLDWKDNPTRRRGLYKMEKGRPVALEKDNPLPPEYDPPSKDVLTTLSRLRRNGFKIDGTIRSPWYDRECDRMMATPQFIAQELDRSYGGSMFRIYGESFSTAAEQTVRVPFVRGILGYHSETLEPEFDPAEDGQFLLWVHLDAQNRPAKSMYVVGCDISSGLGGSYTSNSVLEVFDIVTMEQVGEFATNTMVPDDFADLSIATCKWFHGAYLVWEANGPGAAYTKRIMEKRYPNIYYRTAIFKKGGKRKKTKEPGWWSDPKSKEAMHSELSRSVRTSELILRSKDLVRECGQYVRGPGGKIIHVQVATASDDSSGEAHGDRTVGACVAVQGIRDRPLYKVEDQPVESDSYPASTPASRLAEYEASIKRDPVWDERSNWDMAQTSIMDW